MSNQNSFPIHFHKIEPHNNMRRFYTLSVQPNLFGEWCVMRYWGRIGTLGQSQQQTVSEVVRFVCTVSGVSLSGFPPRLCRHHH
ncbi:hypothetical protein DKP76_18155, partial [Falsochrobactrum shanghaiense]